MVNKEPWSLVTLNRQSVNSGRNVEIVETGNKLVLSRKKIKQGKSSFGFGGGMRERIVVEYSISVRGKWHV